MLVSLSNVEWLLFQSTDQPDAADQGDVGTESHEVGRRGLVVDELFAFQLITGRLCDTCHQLSVTIEPCYTLPLPLPDPQTTQVHSSNKPL